MQNNNFIDQCKLLGIYKNKEVFLDISSKYKSARLFLHTILLSPSGANLIK